MQGLYLVKQAVFWEKKYQKYKDEKKEW